MAGAGPGDPKEDAAFIEAARQLVSGIETALPGWVERSVARLLADSGRDDLRARDEARDAGRRAAEEVGAEIRALLTTDFARQTETPLAVLRRAVRYPTDVLARAGVPPVRRDSFAASSFPDDPYGLTPASYAQVDPDLVELGLRWGVAKAVEHRRREGGAA